MRSRIHRCFWICAILVAAGFVLFAFSRPKAQFPMVVRLNDGSQIRILKMEYGTNVYLTNLTVWQKILVKVPPKLRPPGFRSPPLFTLSKPSVIMLWHDESRNRNGSLFFELENENSFKQQVWNPLKKPYYIAGNETYVFPNFPGRSNVKMRIYSVKQTSPRPGFATDQNALEGEINVRNNFTPKTAP